MTPVARLAAAGLAAAAPLAAQAVDWRFGLEDTWAQLAGQLTPEQTELLLAKMELLTAAQPAGGDVNVNGLAGGWNGMQSAAGAPIDFSASDRLVRLLQAHRFSMLWNLRINAPWASAGNSGCYRLADLPATDCAPDGDHQDDLYDYVSAVVERYDGDGIDDMGHETPADPSDDLAVPIRFYLMTGEIELAGANSADPDTYGDGATSHFWSDTIEHLLETHRVVHQAIHDADPSGASKLVSSGGVLWDLYGDLPDWPAFDGPTVAARLAGANNHGATYGASIARLETMLASFGDDSDGIECDYVGWHPHMPWRAIEQELAWVRSLAGDKPIYVDDMWVNLFLMEREDAPGYAQFGDGGGAFHGDFPNPLAIDFPTLGNGIWLNLLGIREWYDGRTSRQLVKAFVSAFGEGAERVSFSGNADHNLDRLLGITGWLNLMGAAGESFSEKPAYWTYRTLVEKLHDFTCVAELDVSADPRTRVYRFERPRGPLWIGWSETAAAPPGLDYGIADGETVGFAVGAPELIETTIVDVWGETEPASSALEAPAGAVIIALGYRPRILERPPALYADGFECGGLSSWSAISP